MRAHQALPGLVLLLALVAGSAAFFRMAGALAPWDANPYGLNHHYEYLTEGFLSGHTYLSLEPDADLLKLADPARQGWSVQRKLIDASIYRGKYYLYFGPTPAVLLMAPWRLLTGHMLPQRLAVASFAAGGLAALALLLWEIRRRHFPGVSAAALAWAFLVALHASWLPVVARRPYFWELPIVAAVACLWWSLYFLWKYHDSGGRARWALAAGIALGFLIGSRPTWVPAAAAFLCLLCAGSGARSRWPAAGAASLVFLAGVALLAYNHARFGQWLEFGQNHQLAGDDYSGRTFFSPRYLLMNLRMYLFACTVPSPYFPFVQPTFPSDGPAGYLSVDEIHGALVAMPAHLAGIAALVWAARRRRDPAARPVVLTIGGGLAATVFAGGIYLCWVGANTRYAAELWAGWTVITALGILVLFDPLGESRWSRTLRLGAVILGAWTIGYVWLASMDFNEVFRRSRPECYAALARSMDYPSYGWARAKGRAFGPVDLDVRIPASGPSRSDPLLVSGRPDRPSWLVLNRLDGGRARLDLVEDKSRLVLSSPEFPVGDGIVHVRLEAPWLYPPADSPYWDGVKDPVLRHALQRRFAIAVDGAEPAVASAASEDATGFAPVAATRRGGPQAGWIESIHAAK